MGVCGVKKGHKKKKNTVKIEWLQEKKIQVLCGKKYIAEWIKSEKETWKLHGTEWNMCYRIATKLHEYANEK